jgi:hypothetical protein
MEQVHSGAAAVHEKLGGLTAIDMLIDVESASNVKQITRMANSLHPVLANRDVQVSGLAAKVLGKLARTRANLLSDLLGSCLLPSSSFATSSTMLINQFNNEQRMNSRERWSGWRIQKRTPTLHFFC